MNDGATRLRKYGMAALVLVAYAGASAWIVAGEGEAYRESHRKAIASKPIAAPPHPEAPVDRPDPAGKPPTELARGPEPDPEPNPAVPEEQAPVPKPGVPPKRVVTKPSGKATAKGSTPAPIDIFWDQPAQQKVWDVDHLKVEDERDLGLALNQMVLHDHPKFNGGGAMLRRLKDAAKPYLAARDRKDLEYTFTVLDCPKMNVFSHPGGYIYACKGLFDWISEDKDYALEFLIAHEIRHVDQAHAITCLRGPGDKPKIGTVTMFYAVVIPAGFYPEEMDLDADRWAAGQMLKAGRSRFQTLAFLRRLQDYSKLPENDFENERKKPKDEPKIRLLDNHIRAHPSPSDRVEELKAFIDRRLKI